MKKISEVEDALLASINGGARAVGGDYFLVGTLGKFKIDDNLGRKAPSRWLVDDVELIDKLGFGKLEIVHTESVFFTN